MEGISFNPWNSARSSEVSPERPARSTEQQIVTDRNRESLDRQQSSSPIEYTSENTDYFDHNISARPPQRSATLPNTLQHRAVRQIRFESNGHINQNARRQSTTDTKYSATFEETAAWDQKAILSLDGGGIRGYSALLIIKGIMKAVKRKETTWPAGPHEADGPAESSYHPLSSTQVMATDTRSLSGDEDTEDQSSGSSQWLPCHYFDYIAGTSTGGLISIMLGRLRMNIDDCILDYERLGGEVFGHSRWFHLRSPLWIPRDKYNHETLESVVQDVVVRRSPKIPKFPGGQNFAFDEARCRTVVISYQQQSNEDARRKGVERPYLFRTYKNLRQSDTAQERKTDRNPGPAHDIPIWQVARATSAAPTYFKPANVQGLKYLDGGFGANNPCAEIFEEVRKLNNHTPTCANIILSIGTGRDKDWSRFSSSGPSRFLNYLNVARKWASESDETHERMITWTSQFPLKYFRLSVEDGLGPMKLDAWHARGPIRLSLGRGIARFRKFCGAKAGNVQPPTPSTNGHLEMSQVGTQLNPAINPRTQAPAQNGNTVESHRHVGSGLSSDSDTQCSLIPQFFQTKNKTLASIRKHTCKYLLDPEVQQWIEEIAEILVKGRRARAKTDPHRWEKACFGAWFQCKIKGCPRGEKEYGLRRSMQKHLLDKHGDVFNREQGEALEQALDDCKIVVH